MHGFEKRRAFVVSKLPEGTYWKTDEEEYNVQIHCTKSLVYTISEIFSDWTKVADGVDPSKNEKILIFKKNTKEKDFNRMLSEITTHQTINLKEVK